MQQTDYIGQSWQEQMTVKSEKNEKSAELSFSSPIVSLEPLPGAVEIEYEVAKPLKHIALTIVLLTLLLLTSFLTFWSISIGKIVISLPLGLAAFVAGFFFWQQARLLKAKKRLRISQRGISLKSLPKKTKGDFKRTRDTVRKIVLFPQPNPEKLDDKVCYKLIALSRSGYEITLIPKISGAREAIYILEQVRMIKSV